jgi:hypothetical protein
MKLELFSTPIFITNIDLDKIKIESENFAKEWHSNTLSSFGFTNKLNASSYNYLMSVICSLLSNHLHAENELQLLNIWENKYEKDDFQENHIHTDSHFSFIIYVKGKKSNTVFFAPHKYLLECFYGDSLYPYSYQSECASGQIIVFPSYLEHMVKKNTDSVTYAGNIKMIKKKERAIMWKKENEQSNTDR